MFDGNIAIFLGDIAILDGVVINHEGAVTSMICDI